MKSTNAFKNTIKEHLKFRAFKDPMFAKHLKKPNKNLDDCITYIINTVKSSGSNGFADEDIFNMAFHYYVEDSVKIGSKSTSNNVVINHQVKLTAEEKKEAKEKAYQEVVDAEKKRLTTRKKRTTPTPSKADDEPQTLF